jgi:hypothetical protein
VDFLKNGTTINSQWYRTNLNNVRQRIHRVRTNRNVKDVLLFTTTPGVTSACVHMRQSKKMGWTVLPHPAHNSPDLATSDYYLLGPVKDALRKCHFGDDNDETKFS